MDRVPYDQQEAVLEQAENDVMRFVEAIALECMEAFRANRRVNIALDEVCDGLYHELVEGLFGKRMVPLHESTFGERTEE